jgi:hypothetical protein
VTTGRPFSRWRHRNGPARPRTWRPAATPDWRREPCAYEGTLAQPVPTTNGYSYDGRDMAERFIGRAPILGVLVDWADEVFTTSRL